MEPPPILEQDKVDPGVPQPQRFNFAHPPPLLKGLTRKAFLIHHKEIHRFGMLGDNRIHIVDQGRVQKQSLAVLDSEDEPETGGAVWQCDGGGLVWKLLVCYWGALVSLCVAGREWCLGSAQVWLFCWQVAGVIIR